MQFFQILNATKTCPTDSQKTSIKKYASRRYMIQALLISRRQIYKNSE